MKRGIGLRPGTPEGVLGVVISSKNITHMTKSLHSAHFIDKLTPEDMSAIDGTDVNMGPMIYGSIWAFARTEQLRSRSVWKDNIKLY